MSQSNSVSHDFTFPSHCLTLKDWSSTQLNDLLSLAGILKADPLAYQSLSQKTLAMIFHKASTRTRISFEVGAFQLGAHALMISAQSSQISRGESIADTARVLSSYVDAVMIRTFSHESLEEWRRYASIPIINGLTDLYHPCQILADLLTCCEAFGSSIQSQWQDVQVAWVGDGNNMAHSWIEAAATLGFHLRLACPEGYQPNEEVLQNAQKAGARIEVSTDVRAMVEGAWVVNTDVWTSMGQEEESARRLKAFAGYEVTNDLMNLADDRGIFLHCLPAHRGEEVSATVIDGPRSLVWKQAENRLHAQKALMTCLINPSFAKERLT